MTTAVEIAERGHHLAAWVNFDGTLDENSGGLTAGENVLIRASYNVSSCQYNGAGDYTINFATAMPDANYSATALCGFDTDGNSPNIHVAEISRNAAPAEGGIRIDTMSTGPIQRDLKFVCIAIFR